MHTQFDAHEIYSLRENDNFMIFRGGNALCVQTAWTQILIKGYCCDPRMKMIASLNSLFLETWVWKKYGVANL